MAVDTPATVVVLGAGPIGLEAALYARFLGYDVIVLERGEVGTHLLQWGSVRLFTPFRMNASPLALAALDAHGASDTLPARDDLLTGREYVERWLRPLAESDLLDGCIKTGCEVLAVGKTGPLKGELVGDEERGDYDFRILYRDAAGEEKSLLADVVIDATGTYGQPNFLGEGGIPALGERALSDRISYRLPDVLGADRARFLGRRTLLVGHGYSAATAAVALAELHAADASTQVRWLTLSPADRPVPSFPDDSIPARAELARRANDLAAKLPAGWERHAESAVTALRSTPTGIEVEIDGPTPTKFEVDEILALVGYRPDWSFVRELQIQTCYATEGPLKLASALAARPTGDCLTPPASSVDLLVCPEPNYYVLGAKSYGRNGAFLLQTGFHQIRDLFALVGDRPDLDLYRTVGGSLPK